MNVFRAAATLLAAWLISAPVSAQMVDYQRLDDRLTTLAAGDDIVGLSVAVIENGEITFAKGYGLTRLGDGVPVTDQTVFRWASLSKGVASSTAVRLVKEDLLSLSDTVASLGTSLRLPGGGEKRATLENLLSHMVGIVPNAYDTRLEDGRDPVTIRRAIGRLRATCAVGECHTYQNVAFDAVSEAIESRTGQSYAETVSSRIFEPLEMATASFGRVALQSAKEWAEPHVRRSGVTQRRNVKEAYYRVPAAGGANGSIRDLALFARAQMGLAPDVLSTDVLAALHTPRIYTRREQSSMSRRYGGHLRDARYALGWRVYKYGEAGHRVVGHRGAVEGYRSLILLDPERDSGVVALWNSNARVPVGVQFEVMDMIYGLPARDWLGLDSAMVGAAR